MRSTLFDGTVRRWSLMVALVAGLATLWITLAPSLDAQDQPLPPQYFWGTDADNYVGAEVKVFDQNRNELPACPESAQCGEHVGMVSGEGEWHVAVDSRETSKVRLRIVSSSESRETNLLDVVGGDGEAVSIRQFVNVVQVDTTPTETLPIKIRVRLHPTRELRTLEFNIEVNGEEVTRARRNAISRRACLPTDGCRVHRLTPATATRSESSLASSPMTMCCSASGLQATTTSSRVCIGCRAESPTTTGSAATSSRSRARDAAKMSSGWAADADCSGSPIK